MISSFNKSLDQTQCKSYFHSCILAADLSNKNNKKNFLRCVWSKGLLKLDIMVRKAAMVTYILSSSKNLENYRKLIYDEKRSHFGSRCSRYVK